MVLWMSYLIKYSRVKNMKLNMFLPLFVIHFNSFPTYLICLWYILILWDTPNLPHLFADELALFGVQLELLGRGRVYLGL